MREIVLRSPATIANVGPGFDVFAFALEEPFDLLRVRLNEGGRVTVAVTGGDVSLPTEPERNTAGLAALRFLQWTGLKTGVEIEIVKRMPTCSGLGSSAASAVAAAWGLNALTGAGLSSVEVVDIASWGEAASGGARHADNVAACCLGGFVLVRGLDPLRVDRMAVPRIPVVVQVRRKAQTTTRGLIPAVFPLKIVTAQMAGCAALVHALLSGDIAGFGQAVNFDEISEPVRSRAIPGYDRLKARVLDSGAYGFNVSGGGSSVFAVCPEDRMEAVAATMRDEAGVVIKTYASNEGLGVWGGL